MIYALFGSITEIMTQWQKKRKQKLLEKLQLTKKRKKKKQ